MRISNFIIINGAIVATGFLAATTLLPGCTEASAKIDRKALVERNNPHLTSADTLASLTVGNGGFAFTADITGIQTFPEEYANGVPLGTMSDWGWHSYPNVDSLRFEETLREYDFGRGRTELYSTQIKDDERKKAACDYYRVNPHRLHLGALGFHGMDFNSIEGIDQTLDMWNGVINSKFTADGSEIAVQTSVDPELDLVAAKISDSKRHSLALRLPYPTGKHSDSGCDWTADSLHTSEIVLSEPGKAVVKHSLDTTSYFITLNWDGNTLAEKESANTIVITPDADKWSVTAQFTENITDGNNPVADNAIKAASDYWQSFWKDGGVVDFSECTDPRAKELERRVVLSQYLLATNCAGNTPPQETGLTYNSWFGKFHLEMIWWHQAQFALYGHEDLLARTLPWYATARDNAKAIAERQGFEGVRWMKMTDPSSIEAPSSVGSFLIWQQPHLIYLAELLYRANPNDSVLKQYYPLIDETAQFMASFADRDEENDRYILKGIIPAQETLRASETVNPPFELSYWHFGLNTAQKWRERMGLERNADWDKIINGLSHLAAKDSLYLAAETAPQTYEDIRFTSDHMAVLGAQGILPASPLAEPEILNNTFDWIYDNWNWDKTWGWDYPTTAMCAARVGEPEKAVNALMMDKRTNTYLPNGHNFQDNRLRCYLPGNGGLLTAIALMTAGWDGCEIENPGFPKDGTWNVKWEGIKPLP